MFSTRVLASELAEHVGERVTIAGWLHRKRELKSVTFLVIRDRTGLVQVVLATPEEIAAAEGLPEETVQIVPDSQSDDAMYRLWGALQHKYRCSAYIRARVLRIGYGPGNDWPAVVVTRFGLAPVDDVLVPS